MKVAVVVSTWTENPHDHLRALVRSLAAHPAGIDFDLALCANGPDYRLPADLETRFDAVFVRENTGLNLGAWDHAWRRLAEHDRFLFVQDDCHAIRSGWLADFARRFDSVPRCGLVGENLNRGWNRTWDELADSARPAPDATKAQRARFYRERIAAWGIPPGITARHLTSVVHFTSREVLEEVDGYRIGATYEEAIAAEIAFSRAIEAAGRILVQIGAARHSRIAHRQWKSGSLLGSVRRKLRERRL